MHEFPPDQPRKTAEQNTQKNTQLTVRVLVRFSSIIFQLNTLQGLPDRMNAAHGRAPVFSREREPTGVSESLAQFSAGWLRAPALLVSQTMAERFCGRRQRLGWAGTFGQL